MKSPSFCLLPLALAAVPVAAQPPGRSAAADEQVIARCIHRSARGKSWLEKTLWGLRDQEAGWIGAQIPNRDGSHDLGPMQVNSWWIRVFSRLLSRSGPEIRRWLRDDACFNVEAARWIFLSEMAKTTDYWQAIGAYHSPVRSRRLRYAVAVQRRIKAKPLKGGAPGI